MIIGSPTAGLEIGFLDKIYYSGRIVKLK